MFNLTNYTSEIQSIATTCKCSAEAAVDKFIVNLATMHEHHKGASELNFHELGQQWNKLGYKEKNKQKAAALQQVAKARRASRVTTE